MYDKLVEDFKELVVPDCLTKLTEAIKTCRGAKKATFAWSIIISITSNICAAQCGAVLGEAAHLCCQTILREENKLALRPFDLEKLLSNVAGKLIEASEYTWACCLCSHLYERLRLLHSSQEITQIMSDLNLGKDFLNHPPLLDGSHPNPIFRKLALFCQAFWIRLYFANYEHVNVEFLHKILFHSDGIVQKIREETELVDSFLRHWKLSICLALVRSHPLLTEALEFEMKIFGHLKLDRPDQRFKHFMAYLQVAPLHIVETLQNLWCFELHSHEKANEYFAKLDQLTLERLERLVLLDNLSIADRTILRLLLSLKSIQAVDMSQALDQRINTSVSGELWISHRIGKFLSKNISLSSSIIEHVFNILILLNSFEIIRHVHTLHVYESAFRATIQNAIESIDSRLEILLRATKRIIKLGLHFKQGPKIATKLTSCANYLISKNKCEPAHKLLCLIDAHCPLESTDRMQTPNLDSSPEVLASISDFFVASEVLVTPRNRPSNDSDFISLLAGSWTSLLMKSKVSQLSKHVDIAMRITKILSTKCADPSDILKSLLLSFDFNLELFIEANLTMIASKAAALHGSNWLELCQRNLENVERNSKLSIQCLILLWTYILGQDTREPVNAIGSTIVTFGVPATNIVVADNLVKATGILLDLLGETELSANFSSATISPIVSKSQTEYLQGNLGESYRIIRDHYDALFLSLKTVSRGILDLWSTYVELLDSLEWLVHLCKIAGAGKLGGHFAKAGLVYCDSVRSPKRKGHFLQKQENDFTHSENRSVYSLIKDIQDKLDLEIQRYEKQNLKGIQVFTGTRFASLDDEMATLLNLAWNCGMPSQVRQVVCLILTVVNDPRLMIRLIRMAKEREMVDLTEETILFRDSEEDRFKDKPSKDQQLELFIDNKRDLLYIATQSHTLLLDRGPMAARIKLEVPFNSLFAEMQSIIEDNKRMLFKPGSLPTDENAKREWWQSRYDLQKRLETLLRDLDVILKPIAPFISSLNTNKPNGDRLKDICLPDNISQIHLFRALQDSDGSNVAFLEALAIGRSEIKKIATILSSSKPVSNGSDNPFFKETTKEANVLMLTPDRYLYDFPWEALGTFRDVCIIRTFGLSQSQHTRELSIDRIATILNPSGDLKRTEEQLAPLFENLCNKALIRGRAPTKEEMRSVLGESDLTIYVGHGSGDAYLSANEIGQINPCAATFLFGCSSGRLVSPSPLSNPEGALLAYRKAKSPLVLANLWDVTDRDIDKLTVQFFERLDLDGKRLISAAQCSLALKSSRHVCLLRLLNGAAPVIFIN